MPHVQQTTVPQVQADMLAAAGTLRKRTGARALVSVGFCFGGMQSFLAGADLSSELSAVIGFHGILGGARFGIAGPLDRAAEIGCPVLGLFGGADPAVPTEEVEQFDARLAEAGVNHEVVVYPGAPHSFFDRHYEEHAEAYEDAWRRVLGFLERNLDAVRA